MDHRRRSGLAGGILLIAVGIMLLAIQLIPNLRLTFSWPWIIIAVGGFLLLLGALVGAAEMAVPACIVAGVGGILYWQNSTGNWESWAYAWTLILGFAGAGIILSGLLGGQFLKRLRDGIEAILVSLVLFAIFGSFFGRLTLLGKYWPVLLILWGLWILVRRLLGGVGRKGKAA